MPYRRQKGWGLAKPPCGTPLNMGHPLARGLLGFWLLNEGGGGTALDQVGNLNLGTITSVPWCEGLFGTGLNFPGTSGKYVSTKTSVSGAPGFTIGCWVNLGAMGAFTYLMGDGGFSGLRCVSGTTPTLCDGAQDISSSVSIGGVWTQVVGTLDGTNGIIYINGQKKNSAASSVTAFNVTELGACNTGTSNGTLLMDHAFFYKRPLSPTEVLALFQQPFGMFATPRRRIISGSGAVASRQQTLTVLGCGA